MCTTRFNSGFYYRPKQAKASKHCRIERCRGASLISPHKKPTKGSLCFFKILSRDLPTTWMKKNVLLLWHRWVISQSILAAPLGMNHECSSILGSSSKFRVLAVLSVNWCAGEFSLHLERRRLRCCAVCKAWFPECSLCNINSIISSLIITSVARGLIGAYDADPQSFCMGTLCESSLGRSFSQCHACSLGSACLTRWKSSLEISAARIPRKTEP